MNQPNQSAQEWLVKGMHCAGCAGRLETALRAVPGVGEASVNFATSSASVRWRNGSGIASNTVAGRSDLVEKAIREAGFAVELPPESAFQEMERRSEELIKAARLWLAAVIGFCPLALWTMAGHVWPDSFAARNFPGRVFVEMGLSAFVVFVAARGILLAGWAALRRGAPDMNVLLGAGATLAWGGSVAAWLAGVPAHEGSYFEAAAGIVTFALFGRWLELRNRFKAGESIVALAELQPGVASVEKDSGVEAVPLSGVSVGMCVRVAPGERIPVDGEVLEGHSTVDESWVTGESVPVVRGPGQRVIGGTLNGDGALRLRVESAGAQAFLQQVLKIVREAQAGKPQVQRLADRVSVHFALWVVIAAVITSGVWWFVGAPDGRLQTALLRGLSVLVVACPCALGLATSVAVLAGTGRGAQLGILFRNGEVLETLAKVRVVAFDKTGTLTHGRLEVEEWWERKSFEGALLGMVAAAEKQSVHPAALAVVRAAARLGVPVGEAAKVEAVPGCGLKAEVAEERLLVGTAVWLEKEGVFLPDTPPIEREQRLWVAVDGEFAGWFRVADQIRAESAAVVSELKRRGIEPVLVSGDNATTAGRVAELAGITRVFAGVRPDGKREIVQGLQSEGLTAMLGDGVNDTPALAQADVGVAMGGGTAAARQTADVTLIRDDLRSLLDAVDLSQKTLRVIRENLFLAFGYNVLAVPLAAGVFSGRLGWTPGPVAASAAMAVSSVSVVLNALRLRSFGRKR
jgi:Cu+-exporting ATPase